jgi:uncharacterized protein
MTYFWAALIGLASGVCSGLFGVGGGVVMVPAMVLLLGFDMKKAVGTSLAVIIPTALVSSFKHYKNGNIDWAMTLSLAPWAVLSGYVGAWLTRHVQSDSLKRAFGVFLVLVGLYIVFGDRLGGARKTAGPAAAPAPSART